jgi:hypothetical protein
MKPIGRRIFIFLASIFGVAAIAADFDGSEPLICSFGQVVECVEGSECAAVTHASVDAPDFVKLDFSRKQIVSNSAGEDSPPDDIDYFVKLTTHLVVQGVQGTSGDTLGWSMSINDATGHMVLTGAGENAGFVIFGACTPI